MKVSRRKLRRNAYRKREQLNYLAEKQFENDFLTHMGTWGLTSCPDCGADVEPRYFLDKPSSVTYKTSNGMAHLDFSPSVCDRVQSCPGEIDGWMDLKASDSNWGKVTYKRYKNCEQNY